MTIANASAQPNSASVRLQDVTRDNWKACARLTLPPDQVAFLAPNVFSIAEAKFEPHFVPKAICVGEEVVGFLMYCVETEPHDPELFWLFRLMVAASHQGNGYGAGAITLAMEEMRARGAERIRTMHSPSNSVAAKLYAAIGFQAVGVLDDGDIELEFQVT